MKTLILVGLVALLATTAAASTFYRCQVDGRTVISNIPCSRGETMSTRDVQAQPAPKPPIATVPTSGRAESTEAQAERSRQRQQQTEAARERQQKVDDSAARIRAIRAENYDPQKCAAARYRLEVIKQRDPIGWRYDVDASEFQQKASLYCGPDQPLTPPLP